MLEELIGWTDVNIAFRKGHLKIIKNWRLIHIYPIVKVLISKLKLIEWVKSFPIVGSFIIKKINPDTVTRPALTFERYEIIVPYENSFHVIIFMIDANNNFIAFSEDKVVIIHFNMWISDYS